MTSRTGQVIRTWASCKPQTTTPTARTGALFRVERWQRTKAGFFCRSSRDSREDREFYQAKTYSLWIERKPKSKKTGKGGLGTRLLERDFPDRLLAVSVTWKRCAVVWSFCVLVGHCAVCTLGAELNIAWLALARCCHAKPIHGACKRHTVQVSLHCLFS